MKPYSNWFLLQAGATSPFYHNEASNFWACYYHIAPASGEKMKEIVIPVNPKKYARYKLPEKIKSFKNVKKCKLNSYSIKYNFPKNVKLTTKHWIFAPAGIIDNQNRLISVTRQDIIVHEKFRKDIKLYQRREKIRNQNRKLNLLKSYNGKLFKLEPTEKPTKQILQNKLGTPIEIDVYYLEK